MERQSPGHAPGYADTFAYEAATDRERALAIALASFMTLVSIVLIPFAHVKLSGEPSFSLVVEAIAIVALLLTGSTLFAQYRARRYAPIAILASAFCVYGLGHIAYVALSPGTFTRKGMFGADAQSAFWTYLVARYLFLAIVGIFAYAEWRERSGNALPRLTVQRAGYGGLGTLVVFVVAFVTMHQFLPVIVAGRDRYTTLFVYGLQPLSALAGVAALIAIAAVCGLRTRVSVWLCVTVLAQILEIVMAGSIGGARFSVGWYGARLDLAIGSLLFIVAMQVQLAGILQRAARASTRAHTLFRLSNSGDSARETNTKLVEAALLELDFEWGFLARCEDDRVAIDIGVGTAPERDPRSRLESSFLPCLTSRELFVMDPTARATSQRTWGAFACVPVFVDGRFYGSAGFANRARRKPPLSDADRDFMYLLGILVGAAIERDRRAARLTGLAFYDSLTGLPNRAHLQETLAERFAHGQRHGTPFALHFLDLDFFKPINDRYGHAVGDEVLREVASRLRRNVRDEDTVARLGGDEFVIVQKLDTVAGAPEALRDRIVAAFDVPINTRAASLTVGASIGIARFPEDGLDVDALLAAADKAQYAVKNRRRWVPARVVPIERRRGSNAS